MDSAYHYVLFGALTICIGLIARKSIPQRPLFKDDDEEQHDQ